MASRVNTVIEIPELSEFPLSHLNENLYEGFALGQYDAMGDKILSDHIGYDARGLASLCTLRVRFPGLDGGLMSNWAAGLLFVKEAP